MRNNDPLIEQYRQEVENIDKYISKLKAQLSAENNTEKRLKLFKRIKLLNTERYEIMRDIRQMES